VSDFTRAEVCAVAIAELFRGDGELLASPIGNLPTLGARLAKLTFEPELLLSDGVAFLLASVPPLGGAGARSRSSRAGSPTARCSTWSGREGATW